MQRNKSPNTLLKLSHDVKNTTAIMGSGKGGDLIAQISDMHQRNMTQLPMGTKFPKHQAQIEGMDSKTKFELLRKSNQIESSYNTGGQFSSSNNQLNQQHVSLEQIRERIFQSPSENPLASEQELTTENEFMSIQSQDHKDFFQPDNNSNVKKRESNLKIGVNRITNSKQQKATTGATSGTGARSPFVV